MNLGCSLSVTYESVTLGMASTQGASVLQKSPTSKPLKHGSACTTLKVNRRLALFHACVDGTLCAPQKILIKSLLSNAEKCKTGG